MKGFDWLCENKFSVYGQRMADWHAIIKLKNPKFFLLDSDVYLFMYIDMDVVAGKTCFLISAGL